MPMYMFYTDWNDFVEKVCDMMSMYMFYTDWNDFVEKVCDMMSLCSKS